MSIKELKLEVNGVKHWVKTVHNFDTTPILVIHGGPGGNNYAFEHSTGRELEKYFNVIYYEQRGSGRSDPPVNGDYALETLTNDLKKIIQFLNYKEVILLGYSFGAELSLHFAYEYPELTHSVLCFSPTDITNYKGMVTNQISGFRQVSTPSELSVINELFDKGLSESDILDQIWSSFSVETYDRFLFHKEENAKEMRKLWAQSQLYNTGEMFEYLRNQRYLDKLSSKVKKISSRVFIGIGYHDLNCGVGLACKIHKLLPNSYIKIFYDSAHFVDFEETDLYIEEIISFLTD